MSRYSASKIGQNICPLCGSVTSRVRHIKANIGALPMSICECTKCRLGFQNRQPTVQESVDYMNWRWSSTDLSDRYVTDIEARWRGFQSKLNLLGSCHSPNKRLLDVGAGNGVFCAAAKNAGYDASGFDRSEVAVRKAKELWGIELSQGDIDCIPCDPKFGIVTMWDVIEHLRDPLETLRQAWNRLENGGVIFLETGNYESASRLVAGDQWSLYLFDHMFYFTPTSLENLLEQAGFQNFKLHLPLITNSLPSTHAAKASKLRDHCKIFLKRGIQVFRNPSRIGRKAHAEALLFKAKRMWPNHWNMRLLLASAQKLKP